MSGNHNFTHRLLQVAHIFQFIQSESGAAGSLQSFMVPAEPDRYLVISKLTGEVTQIAFATTLEHLVSCVADLHLDPDYEIEVWDLDGDRTRLRQLS